MPWVVLLLSAVCEAVWATALGLSQGLSLPGPTAVFAVGLAASMLGLGYAATRIPIGTAYPVWVGVGAALTVAYAMATGAESASPAKILFLLGIVGAVVGLKLLPQEPADAVSPRRPGT
ncbi:DMT family transporter [Microbacterium sediminis]|uniref:Ligand-binding protein SH3 n=1 Tax=Microbacterium sediminis TaxID=904291 RepID=A0A1B9N854_9MICO|nr:multidrug efflux SMR transporter [Microbacterium sediminis]OCG72714.1 ligand-binding protein SH3 [Microbacterium sediminis]QBR74772.1 multidrug efflux SMR transporter [Microbacterium sediminis]